MMVPTTASPRNVLREDLPLPLCVLRATALERNIARFQRYTEESGVLLSPHAKTAMSPALFGRQLAAGCCGLTFANCAQLEVARRHGVPRVFYANQLVGAADIRYVCDELRRDPGFDFYCLVDSVPGVRLLASRVTDAAPGRPVSVLVEGGLAGGRCGVRDVETAVDVAEAVRAAGPRLALAGVEGFEGLAQYRDASRRDADVREFLGFMVRIAETLDGRGLFGPGLVILSAGRRDFGQDAGNPVALTHVRRGTVERHPLRESGWQMAAASDQHAHMTAPPGHGAEVGDLVALGPSHPCTTFDKWRTVHLVDDDYNILEAIPTYF